MTSPVPISGTWGPEQIRHLFDKLASMDQKIETCLGQSTSFHDLEIQVRMLDQKVDTLKAEIDRGIRVVVTELGQAKSTAGDPNVDSAYGAAGSLAVVIKEEGIDFESEFPEEPEGMWPGLVNDVEQNVNIPSIDRNTRSSLSNKSNNVTKRLPVIMPMISRHLSNPRAIIINKKGPVSTTTTIRSNSAKQDSQLYSRSCDQEQIIIAPNPVLGAQSKDQLGDVQPDESTGKFPCPECAKQFFHKTHLIRHYFVHSGLKPYSCTKCSAAFSRSDKLLQHFRTYHLNDTGTSSNPNPSPPKTGRTRTESSRSSPKLKLKSLDLDDDTMTNKMPFQYEFHCKLCPENQTEGFNEALKLAEHYTKNHDPPHGLQSIEELSILCPTCGKPFISKKKLERHQLTHFGKHENTRRQVCELCGMRFRKRAGLLNHRKRKHPTPEQKAERQRRKEQATALRSNFRRHSRIKNIKPKLFSSYPCPDCGKVFGMKGKLNAHLIGCRNLKRFQCEECGLALSYKSKLKEHIANVHQGQKRYHCADCGKSFFLASGYKRHLLYHRGIKPYICQHCGQGFTERNDLRRHEMSHLGIKNVQCPQCEMKFYRQSHLKRHMVVHTGERAYACDECEMRFTDAGGLKRHKILHVRPPLRRPHIGPRIRRQPRNTKGRPSRLLLKDLEKPTEPNNDNSNNLEQDTGTESSLILPQRSADTSQMLPTVFS